MYPLKYSEHVKNSHIPTVGGPVTYCPRRESLCSSGWMHTWRSCWRRPTKTRGCWGIWKTTIGPECMFARRKWKCSKGGWPRPSRGRRRPTHSASWPRLPLLIMAPTSLFTAPSTNFFGSFGSFLAFLGNLQVLAPQQVSPPVRPFIMATQFGKNSAFLDFSCKVTHAYGWTWIFTGFWASKRSKYMQNLTFCPFFELQEAVLG